MWSLILRVVPLLAALGAGAWAMHHWDEGTIADLKLADQAAQTRALSNALARQKREDRATLAAALKDAAAQTRIVTLTKTIKERIPVYVTAKSDAACIINHGFVRVFDAAAGGVDPAELPGTAGEPDDAPAAVTLSGVAALSADNDAAARANAKQLEDLQDWIRAQEAIEPGGK